MGLIKAAVSSVGGTLHEQWQDLIQCEDMGNEILMKKVTTPGGQISKGSRVLVKPGQVAVIYDSGSILDATAEEGVYEFDKSTSPSFFGGQFGPVFKEMWQRFTYNGAPAKEQAVFYFNAKEILDNKFGTATPIEYQDWSHPIPNQMTGQMQPMSLLVRCYGKYTFRIFDPVVFMRNHAGTSDVVTKDTIVDQMGSEVIGAFQNVLNEMGNSEHKVAVLELPSHTDEIKQTMDSKVFDEPIRKRGISLEGFVVESVSLTDESRTKMDNYELSSNSHLQQGTLVGAYADAVKDAANNEGGAANGFMGIGMMNMASGGMIGGAAVSPFAQNNQAQQPVQQQPVQQQATGQAATAGAKFCSNCGSPVNGGKFCSNCGQQLQ